MPGANMQDSAGSIQNLRQAQGQRKISPLVAGVGAAVIAAAVTVTILSGPTTVSTTDQSASNVKQCALIQRRLLVSTDHGSGTVRFRASGWLSPPFTITKEPQVIVFPLLRPDTAPITETISVEGSATDVVVTSEVTNLHLGFDLAAAHDFSLTWQPKKSC
jgi:hypothetical protein